MQVSPSIELSAFVRHHLFLNITKASTLKLRLFSDGNTGIVLNSYPNLVLDSKPLPEAFLYGQITEFKEVYCQGPAQLSIIVFHSRGLARILNIPASELNNKVIPLAGLFGDAGAIFQRDMRASGKLSEKINLMEDFVRKMADSHPSTGDPMVAIALDLIQRHKGVIPIHHLTDIIGCQPRQLERKFISAVGISPKHLCNIVRVHAFIKLLQSDKKYNLTGFAYDSGYYDQAHLIRDFRKITGLTPTQYIRNSTPLAVNFLQL